MESELHLLLMVELINMFAISESMNSKNPQTDSQMTGKAPPPSSRSTVTSDSKSVVSQRSDMSNPKGNKGKKSKKKTKKKKKRPTAHFKSVEAAKTMNIDE